jgi:hypothetical protein
VTDDARQRAEAFVEFCDGAEEGGLHEYARRGRAIAALLLEALEQLDAEHSARRAFQERVERLEELLLARGSEKTP